MSDGTLTKQKDAAKGLISIYHRWHHLIEATRKTKNYRKQGPVKLQKRRVRTLHPSCRNGRWEGDLDDDCTKKTLVWWKGEGGPVVLRKKEFF
jgi:hypothetical protein